LEVVPKLFDILEGLFKEDEDFLEDEFDESNVEILEDSSNDDDDSEELTPE